MSPDARSALIGGIAAAVISSVIGFFGIATQINAEDKRSSDEFARSQRREVYAKLIADEYQLGRLEVDFKEMVVAAKTPAELSAQRVKLDDAYLTLKSDVGSAMLVGSIEVSIQAREVGLVHERIQDLIHLTDDIVAKNGLDEQEIRRFADSYSNPPAADMTPELQIEDFMEEARVDIQNPDYDRIGDWRLR